MSLLKIKKFSNSKDNMDKIKINTDRVLIIKRL